MDSNEYTKYVTYMIILLIIINIMNTYYLNTRITDISKLNTKLLNSDITAKLVEIPHYIKKSNDIGNQIFNVPLKIYHTWNTKYIPANMAKNINYILNQNPEFDYYLYDDSECRKYIRENFSEDVLDAFDTLIPGAYKADLWRCCVMYKEGGVYMDIKLKPLVKLKKLIEMNNFYFVKDTPSMNGCDFKIGIYNAFLISYPNNIIFKTCIEEIVKNCQLQFYGSNALAVTGPCLLGNIFNEYYNGGYEPFIELHLKKDGCIYNNLGIQITDIYDEYRAEQKKVGTMHYSFMWNNKNIFNLIKYKNSMKNSI
jgi:mannosyltransferase OCH1-like enzyme